MTIQVLQVDPSPRLAPYTYEEEAIAAAGGTLNVANCATEAEVVEQARDAEVLLLSWKSILTPEVMDALPRLRLIVRWGVGYDMIDVAAATERGIAVANAPTYCTQDVAEHAITLLLTVSRHVVWFDRGMRNGDWPPHPGPVHRLTSRTLGIVGCGRIGSAVAARAQGLGFRVIAHDRFRADDEIEALGVTPCSFDELLAEADSITLHVPLNAETRHLIDAAALARMKAGAILVNTSRGPVIDEEALIAAMTTGHIAGAGLDVYAEEPLAPDSPLRALEHVVLTPHSAAFSLESIEELRREMCDTVATWISDSWSASVVNPEVKQALRPRLAATG